MPLGRVNIQPNIQPEERLESRTVVNHNLYKLIYINETDRRMMR